MTMSKENPKFPRQIVLRMTEEMYEAMKARAKKEERDLSAQIRWDLRTVLGLEPSKKPLEITQQIAIGTTLSLKKNPPKLIDAWAMWGRWDSTPDP